ncbi:hypothetical protein KQX54_004275 [Cotesia glomerata]|uniref:Uncharacterized protein n=1 Tax=Cotesia glomerata TaxID=32391 RepID=A0AAV7IJJ2_COTGL|nr:hypothetical protein KQX54_004275 [Cotesia glomerata]
MLKERRRLRDSSIRETGIQTNGQEFKKPTQALQFRIKIKIQQRVLKDVLMRISISVLFLSLKIKDYRNDSSLEACFGPPYSTGASRAASRAASGVKKAQGNPIAGKIAMCPPVVVVDVAVGFMCIIMCTERSVLSVKPFSSVLWSGVLQTGQGRSERNVNTREGEIVLLQTNETWEGGGGGQVKMAEVY